MQRPISILIIFQSPGGLKEKTEIGIENCMYTTSVESSILVYFSS